MRLIWTNCVTVSLRYEDRLASVCHIHQDGKSELDTVVYWQGMQLYKCWVNMVLCRQAEDDMV